MIRRGPLKIKNLDLRYIGMFVSIHVLATHEILDGPLLHPHRAETVEMPIKCAWNVPDLLALGRRIRLPGPAGESEGPTSVSV